MSDTIQLIANCLVNLWMTMTMHVAPHAADTVNVTVAMYVMQAERVGCEGADRGVGDVAVVEPGERP